MYVLHVLKLLCLFKEPNNCLIHDMYVLIKYSWCVSCVLDLGYVWDNKTKVDGKKAERFTPLAINKHKHI